MGTYHTLSPVFCGIVTILYTKYYWFSSFSSYLFFSSLFLSYFLYRTKQLYTTVSFWGTVEISEMCTSNHGHHDFFLQKKIVSTYFPNLCVYLRVYDSPDRSYKDTPWPSLWLWYSLTYEHRSIGYRNIIHPPSVSDWIHRETTVLTCIWQSPEFR